VVVTLAFERNLQTKRKQDYSRPPAARVAVRVAALTAAWRVLCTGLHVLHTLLVKT